MDEPREIAGYIDHTLLRATATKEDIERHCREARMYGFFSVCIPPYYVSLARRLLNGSRIKVGTVIGFPMGFQVTRAKLTESRKALEAGAQEIDMVINLSALRNREYSYVGKEMKRVVNLSKKVTYKMIIETPLLTQEEKVQACELVIESGAHFVKTSTGVMPSAGSLIDDVGLLHKIAGGRIKIKASGGIRDFRTLKSLLQAGASRIGTSSGVSIMQEITNIVTIYPNEV